MVSLQKSKGKIIPVNQLKEGQLAEIVSWKDTSVYNGTIVQIYGGNLIVLGMSCVNFRSLIPTNEGCNVRILEDGETLVVKDNLF